MYIVGQTVEVIVNSDHVECFYEQMESGVPAIRARTKNLTVTLGLYRVKGAIGKAMADLALALMAGDANRMQVYAMPSEGPEGITQTIRQSPGQGGGPEDGEQKAAEPAGSAGMDGAGGN